MSDEIQLRRTHYTQEELNKSENIVFRMYEINSMISTYSLSFSLSQDNKERIQIEIVLHDDNNVEHNLDEIKTTIKRFLIK